MAVPAWLETRFCKYRDEVTNHYEASWYGPLDKLANTIFSDNCFMVKPQPKIRRSAPRLSTPDNDKDEPFNDEGFSTDSMGDVVLRMTRDNPVQEPDFIIVKVHPNPDVMEDTPLICIEVKNEGGPLESSINQLRNYIATLSSKKPHAKFRGLLVLGSRFYGFNVEGRKLGTPQGQGLDTAEKLANWLQTIATEALSQ